jgi:hypothetical protein
MSCDEFHFRHFHKKVTHKRPHSHGRSDDAHHRHTHSGEPDGHDHPAGATQEDADHLHEHTHEAAEHQHPFEHDPLHPAGESEKVLGLNEDALNRKKDGMNHEPIHKEEK